MLLNLIGYNVTILKYLSGPVKERSLGVDPQEGKFTTYILKNLVD